MWGKIRGRKTIETVINLLNSNLYIKMGRSENYFIMILQKKMLIPVEDKATKKASVFCRLPKV